MITFARALFTGQLFDDPATLAMMVEPLPIFDYGLGVAVKDAHWGHEGGVLGYQTVLSYWPEFDAVIVGLTNSYDNRVTIDQTAAEYMRQVLVTD